MTGGLTYAIVTPACNEADTLPQLAGSLASQARRPDTWIVVENGSTDGTQDVCRRLAAEHAWVRVVPLQGDGRTERGGAIVRAIQAGCEVLDPPPDVVVNVDADVTMEPDYFARLIRAFEEDEQLGIASGSAYEIRGDGWVQQHSTRGSVWGATRAYRWACLRDVMPLEPRVGWDGIDEVKANARGWGTRTLRDLAFKHHRREGERDGARAMRWIAQGELAHFMGYRVSYLLARTVFRMLREPSAAGMLAGYARAAARRSPRCDDDAARAYLRSEQRWRRLPVRAREALGRAGG